jgi:hypothetical protein
MVRAADDANDDQLRKAVALAELTGTPVRFSVSTVREALAGTTIVVESDESFAARLGGAPGRRTARPGRREPGPREPEPRDPARLRVLGTVSPSVYMAAAEAGVSVLDEPICSCGRIELVRWVREQVLTRSLHRYGNVVY